MSIEAIKWAIEQAPPMPAQLVATLTGLAYHADKNGRGAYPSAGRLAAFACKDRRSVQRDLKQLRELGLIRLGDQELVAHVAEGKRPEVYDLAVEITVPGGRAGSSEATRASRVTLASSRARGGRRRPSSDATPANPTDDVHVTGGADVTGGVDVPVGVTPTSFEGRRGRHPNLKEEPSLEPKDAAAPVGDTLPFDAPAPADADKPRRTPKKPSKPSKHQEADDLTAAYWDRYKTSTAQSFIAVRGVIRTAITNGIDRNQLAHALDACAQEGRAISGGTLTTALQQIRGRHLRAVPGGYRPAPPADYTADYGNGF